MDTHFERQGETGTAVVFIHGFMGESSDWSAQVDTLSTDHRVLTFDLRGHGNSRSPDCESDYTVEHIVSDTCALILKCGFDRYHLVGHSIGGAVAQEIALRCPDDLLSLVLCDTTDWFGDHDLPGGTPPFIPKSLAQIGERRAGQMSDIALRGMWKGLIEWPGVGDRLDKIHIPTLILFGERDASRIIEGSKRLHKAIHRSQLVTIAGCGHSPHREDPAAFNQVVLSFINSVRESDED